MKLAKLAHPLTLGVILCLTVASVGCRKGLDKTTEIPDGGGAPIGDTPGRPITEGDTVALGDGSETDGTGLVTDLGPEGVGIDAAPNYDDWIEDRDMFVNQTIYFDFDRSNINATEVAKLEEVALRMQNDFPDLALRIEGHCDERGTEEYNRALGDRRAASVRENLVTLGLDPNKLPTISFGEERPADPGHDDIAWDKNRRAELILLRPPGAE